MNDFYSVLLIKNAAAHQKLSVIPPGLVKVRISVIIHIHFLMKFEILESHFYFFLTFKCLTLI